MLCRGLDSAGINGLDVMMFLTYFKLIHVDYNVNDWNSDIDKKQQMSCNDKGKKYAKIRN